MKFIFKFFILAGISTAEDLIVEKTHCKKYLEHETYPPLNQTWYHEARNPRTKWPWLVSLGGYCAGTLLGPRFVVTAAHCCTNPINHNVYIGSPSSLGGVNETYKVVDFRRHEKFNIATVYFDVCLLKLNLPVALTEKSYPICLASRRSEIASFPRNGTVVGWGDQTEFGIPSETILEENLPIWETDECLEKVHYFDSSKSFCAGPKNETVHRCTGDSGAPFVMVEKNQPVLAGITSWGYGCQQGRPFGIHSKIGNVVSWIVNKAIDMGAQMESARSRNHNKMGFLGIGVLKTANSAKSIKKSQKQRQKRLKERENLRVALRKQNLERKFRLKMAQRGEITELKKLKKFLNQNISKHKQKSDQALKMNEIKRLRTISIATPDHVYVYNKCSESGHDEQYALEPIQRVKCSSHNDLFECGFKCLEDNMQTNAILRCTGNVWYATYVTDVETLCTPIPLSPIRLKSLSRGYDRRPCHSGNEMDQKEGELFQMNQFNNYYTPQLTAGNCRLKSNGDYECHAIRCSNTTKLPTSNSARCVKGRWVPRKIKCH